MDTQSVVHRRVGGGRNTKKGLNKHGGGGQTLKINIFNEVFSQLMVHTGMVKKSYGKGGHLGCSEGFNFNLYKPYLPYKVNSQGREQMHAILDKLVPVSGKCLILSS